MYNLTDKQKGVVHWLVEKVQAGQLEEEFMLAWELGSYNRPSFPSSAIVDEEVPRISITMVDALIQEGMLIGRRGKSSSYLCSLTGLAYSAVAAHFVPPAPAPRTQVNITNSHSFIFNVDTVIDSATQTVQAAPHIDTSTKEHLNDLLEQLKEALGQVPEEHAEAAGAVADTAQSLVEHATKPQPNKTSMRLSGEGLKKAAENIANVAPKVLHIATMIITLVGAA